MDVFKNLTIQIVLYEEEKEIIFRCLDNFKKTVIYFSRIFAFYKFKYTIKK